MEIFRKTALGLGIAAFAVCGLFLDLMGGIGLIMNNYSSCGYSLIISVAVFAAAIVLLFFRRSVTDIISAVLNAVATGCYIYPISVLNGIPNAQVPKEAVEILTGRIYPSVAITVLLAAAVLADIFSYDKISARAAIKQKKENEKNRKLTDEEKII